VLYKTTRNNSDTFTAQRVLTMKRGPDGGLFVPFRIPKFSPAEINEFGKMNFNFRLAEILNLLFGTRLTAYDIDLAVGRSTVRLQQWGQRLILAECWHNPQWQFSGMVSDLSGLLVSEQNASLDPEGWAETGIRIALLFGIFGELIREELASYEKPVDISVISGNFSGPMAAWYARTMGLPIGNIVCCCNENGNLWDFICHGQLRTDSIALRTVVPEADVVVPDGLEHLIAAYAGTEEVMRYVEMVRQGSTYYVDEGLLGRLRQGIYVTVSSERRILSTISSCLSTHGGLIAASSALAYAGLQDYRARTGTSRPAVILTEKSPRLDAELSARILGISEQELEKYM